MSTVPVVQDIGDLDLDVGAYKRGKRTKLVGAVLGVAAVLGGGFFALTRLDQPPTAAIEEPKALAAQAPAPVYTPPAPPPTPAPEPTPAPAAATPEADKKDESADKRLSEDVKQALLANDQTKKSAKGSKASKASRAARPRAKAARRSGGGPATGFKSGGNANDPLNGNL